MIIRQILDEMLTYMGINTYGDYDEIIIIDAVKKINNSMTPTDYISRRDIDIVMNNLALFATGIGKSLIQDIKNEILSLPSIPDKSIQIREMVERKIKETTDFYCNHKYTDGLKELLLEIDSLTK